MVSAGAKVGRWYHAVAEPITWLAFTITWLTESFAVSGKSVAKSYAR
jgi:hypothetical protein